MPPEGAGTGRVVLFGATGYTGRLTAEAMVAAGVRPVLAGRDRGRLEALVGRLGGLPVAEATRAGRRASRTSSAGTTCW